MDYFNDPELNGKYLGTITKDFATVSDTLKEASYQIRKREISQFPVFIFARQAVQFGSLLINAGCALRAFLRLEAQRRRTGRSWCEAKKSLLRQALRTYLASPIYLLHLPTA